MNLPKIKIIVTGATILSMALSMYIPSFAATASDKLKDTQSEIKQAKQEANATKSQKETLVKEIKELELQIRTTETDIDSLNNQIKEIQVKVDEAEVKLLEAEKEYEKYEDLLDERLVAMYQAGKVSYLDVLLTSKNLSDFLSKYYLVGKILEYDTEILEGMEAKKKEVEQAKAEVDGQKQQLDDSKADLETKRATLNSNKQQKNSKVSSLDATLQEQIKAIDKLEEDEKELKRQIAASQKGSSGSGNSTYVGGPMAWPTRITKKVNSQYAPNGRPDTSGYVSTPHRGVDIYAPSGTPIYAAQSGTVIIRQYSSSFGNYVVIDHGGGVSTLYAHGSGFGNISVGQQVTTDTLIMYSGNTGWSEGAHLHFEVRINGSSVDPNPYLGIPSGFIGTL